MKDGWTIGGIELQSRFFIGTGKFAEPRLMEAAIRASGAQVVTVALVTEITEAEDISEWAREIRSILQGSGQHV